MKGFRGVDIREAIAQAERMGLRFDHADQSQRIHHFSRLTLRLVRSFGNGIDWGLTFAQYPEILDQIWGQLAAQAPVEPAKPIPMLLTCPSCGERHIDLGAFAECAHHTHACQHCGMCWRPAVVVTVGVQFLPGFKNDSEEEDDDE
jgi:hypothetical protein